MRMLRLVWPAVLVSTLLFNSPARAAMLVLGGGLAHDCYLAAKRDLSDTRSLNACTHEYYIDQSIERPVGNCKTFLRRRRHSRRSQILPQKHPPIIIIHLDVVLVLRPFSMGLLGSHRVLVPC